MRIPNSVVGDIPRALYETANSIRADIKAVATRADELRKSIKPGPAAAGLHSAIDPEAIANATLAYRHLEDASMRLGMVLQALDGGASVYDRATTVGAPDPAAVVGEIARDARIAALQEVVTMIDAAREEGEPDARGLRDRVLSMAGGL